MVERLKRRPCIYTVTKAREMTTRKITGFLKKIGKMLFFFIRIKAAFHSKVAQGAFIACCYQGSPLNFAEIFYRYPWQIRETAIHSHMT
jgi:hypothetical protein